VLVNLLVAAGVVAFPVPALVMGARGFLRRPGYHPDEPADRVSYVLVVCARGLALLLLFVLSALVLVSAVGATVRNVDLHGLVYVFFGLDVLLAVVVVLSFGRRDRRPSHRRVTPAAR
jgi:hypothetical protein